MNTSNSAASSAAKDPHIDYNLLINEIQLTQRHNTYASKIATIKMLTAFLHQEGMNQLASALAKNAEAFVKKED